MTMPEIRLAGPEDAAAVAGLLHAMDAHYGLDVAADLGEALAMVMRTITTGEGTRFVLALAESRPVGLACFVVLRPGRRLAGLVFIKELFVIEGARGRGIGTALFRWLASYARENGIARIDLTTERVNVGAQRLYERIGGIRQDKVFYRFDLETGPPLPDPSV